MNYIAYLLGIDLPGKDGNGKAPHKPGWWAYLSTMKFAIVILIVLGALSLAAMFVNELADPNAMAKQPTSALGAAGRLLFMIFQMEDPFRSWWYRGLMGVLTLSLFACVLERTPIVWRLWKRAASPDTSWVDNAPTAIVRSVKAPRENKARMMRSGTTRKAIRHGNDNSSVSSMARFWAWRAPASSPRAIRRAISGSTTVPAAMPMTPIGS